ncbi:hypothetical protein [Pantoea agglomerans]|uniref:hypothetical protein n=1 Tax=Enterobacter agglomerans TaxID=549 RepID=UPI00045CB968|nr:hypothetical protein [Pantoea agglomerans]KDA93503.1 hypothetical protein T296_17565 [Pantoea agglomerans Eh318]
MHQKYEHVKDIKARIDLLLLQLSEGRYTSLDTYINNLALLKVAYCELEPLTSDPDFLFWLQQKDPTFLLEIALTGRVLMALQNFFRLASSENE